jgi:hypothetical protein
MRGQPLQCLDLSQVLHLYIRTLRVFEENSWAQHADSVMGFNTTYLVNRVEVRLHALDRHILPSLHGLCLEHLGEGTLSQFPDQAIFYTQRRIRWCKSDMGSLVW